MQRIFFSHPSSPLNALIANVLQFREDRQMVDKEKSCKNPKNLYSGSVAECSLFCVEKNTFKHYDPLTAVCIIFD